MFGLDDWIASFSDGFTLSRAPVARTLQRLAPALAVMSLSFGVWYALGALEVAPYYL